MVKLSDVEKHVHKYLPYGFIQNSRVKITYNDKAYYIKIINPNPMLNITIKKIIKYLPSTMGYFEYPTNCFIFAPIETPQQKYDFAEVKSCAIGNEMLDKYKLILEMKQQFADNLKEMLELKKDLI